MEPENKQPKITQLLEKLQEESWQLELLISGFAIFLVASSFSKIRELITQVNVIGMGYGDNELIKIPVIILLSAWLFLLINLVFHVILRGFWIAAIGLRYVSGEINFEALKLAPIFDRYLKKRMPSFDLFIEKLEKICSVVFAFTFILIFMFISMGLFFIAITLMQNGFEFVLPKFMSESIADKIKSGIGIFIFCCAFIYFIDFLTLSRIKRIKWFSGIYYPIYRVFSLITLSFLYRPLYYNLIDEKFGRRVGLLIFPYVLLIMTFVSMKVDSYKYFPTRTSSSEIKHDHYLDVLKENDIVDEVNIPSKYVDSDFLEIFIPYKERHDKAIEHLCPNLRPDKTLGIKFSILTFSNDSKPSPVDSLLQCVSDLHQVFLNDSLYQQAEYHFYKHPHNAENGLISVLDISHLERGQHILKVNTANVISRKNQQDSIAFHVNAKFPFWKE